MVAVCTVYIFNICVDVFTKQVQYWDKRVIYKDNLPRPVNSSLLVRLHCI